MMPSPEDVDKINIMIMEEEIKISGAEHAKKTILLRIAKRKSEMARDEEHITLQDKVIEQARADIERHRKTLKEV